MNGLMRDKPEDTIKQPGVSGAEESKEEELPPPPVWLGKDPPQTGKKMDSIKWALMHGKTEEEIVDAGYNKKTVSMAAYDLDKEGYRDRPRKPRAVKKQESDSSGGSVKAVAEYSKRSLTGPTKGMPPEMLIDQIVLPLDGGQAKNFEMGMKFGLRMSILGVRMAQELGNMGMQQVNPIIAMANAMRAGEALAAKDASTEAAILAAREVVEELGPAIASLRKPSPSSVDNPMKDMISSMMKPFLQKFMGMAFPGAVPTPGTNIPEGWTRRVEEEQPE